MLYRTVKNLIEKKGYSHQRIGYIFASTVVSMDSRRYLSKLKDPIARSQELKAKSVGEYLKIEQRVKANFVRSLDGRVWNEFCGKMPKPSIDTDELKAKAAKLSSFNQRGAVESILYNELETAPGKGTGYLTKLGKNIVEMVNAYHDMLQARKERNSEEGRRVKPKKEGQKKRKIAKRLNPMLNHDRLYDILRQAFEG